MIHVLSVQPADESPTQVDVQMVDGWCAHDGRVYALRFSHDGRYLYTAGSDGLLKCYGFDPTRRTTETAVTSANTRALPLAAAFIPETSRLLVADLGFGISERDCSAELPAHIRTLRLEEPEAVSCSPDGALFAAGSRRGRVVISETKTGKLVREMNLEHCVDELYFSPDGKMLAILTSPLGTNQRRAQRCRCADGK